jgi:hypothetical protein
LRDAINVAGGEAALIDGSNPIRQQVVEGMKKEPRTGTEGNASRQSTYRTQRPENACHRRRSGYGTFAVTQPRWEPCAGIPLARIWAGGGQQ